mgnify:FL=1
MPKASATSPVDIGLPFACMTARTLPAWGGRESAVFGSSRFSLDSQKEFYSKGFLVDEFSQLNLETFGFE